VSYLNDKLVSLEQ